MCCSPVIPIMSQKKYIQREEERDVIYGKVFNVILFKKKKKCLSAVYSEDCMNFCICLVEADMHAYVEVMTLPHE